MKDLKEYLNEAQTGKWAPASNFKLKDLEEGDIVEVVNKMRYILVTPNMLQQLIDSTDNYGKDLVFVRPDPESNFADDYNVSFFNEFTKDLKQIDGMTKFDIVKVYKRPKKYTSVQELENDLKKIKNF